MIIRCLDIETLGLTRDEGVCEIGWCDIISGNPSQVLTPEATLINPGRPIPATASAIHHIVDADVSAAPPLSEALARMLDKRPDILAAHNAKFEQLFLPSLASFPWICSWKIAIMLAPNAPGHNLQTLRYWTKLEIDAGLAAPPHRAGPDAYICAHLIARMLGKMTADQMIEASDRPASLPKFSFGKHQDVPIIQVPYDYLCWVLDNITDDEDVQFTARSELQRRRETQRARSPV